MKATFNRFVTLGSETYAKGTHDVPSADAKGWFWDALVADGGIVVAAAAEKDPKPAAEDPGAKTRKKG